MVEVVRQERVAFFFNQRIVEFSVLHDCFEACARTIVQEEERKQSQRC